MKNSHIKILGKFHYLPEVWALQNFLKLPNLISGHYLVLNGVKNVSYSWLSLCCFSCPFLILIQTKKKKPQPTDLLVETTTTTSVPHHHRYKATLTATQIKPISKSTAEPNQTTLNKFQPPSYADLKGHPANSNTDSIQAQKSPSLNSYPQRIVHINRKYTAPKQHTHRS